MSHAIPALKDKVDEYEFITVDNWRWVLNLGREDKFDNCLSDPREWESYYYCKKMLILVKTNGKDLALITLTYRKEGIDIDEPREKNKQVRGSNEIVKELGTLLFKVIPEDVELVYLDEKLIRLANNEISFVEVEEEDIYDNGDDGFVRNDSFRRIIRNRLRSRG